jgi:signal transduction histidine kinase
MFVDHGIGIPEEDLKIIMEPFQRGKNAHKAKGHGIGLSLVDAILKMHKATIQLHSRVNEGTRFIVKFP